MQTKNKSKKLLQSAYKIQNFEADFLWKDSLKILNSGIILKTVTNVLNKTIHTLDWE